MAVCPAVCFVCVCVFAAVFHESVQMRLGWALRVSWIGRCHIRVWSPLSVWDWCLAVTLPTQNPLSHAALLASGNTKIHVALWVRQHCVFSTDCHQWVLGWIFEVEGTVTFSVSISCHTVYSCLLLSLSYLRQEVKWGLSFVLRKSSFEMDGLYICIWWLCDVCSHELFLPSSLWCMMWLWMSYNIYIIYIYIYILYFLTMLLKNIW